MAKNNATILDLVHVHGSNDYQQRVPVASQNGINAVQDFLLEKGNSRYFNEFQDVLFNRIGTLIINDHGDWRNPFRVFFRDINPYGDKIQELGLDYIEASGYDIRAQNLFKFNPSKVKQAFHKVNREDKYAITITREELRKAFVNEQGLNNFLVQKLELPRKSDMYDEYRIILGMIGRAYAEGDIRKVQVEFADPENPTDVEYKKLSYKIRSIGARLGVAPQTLYNGMGIPQVTRAEDLILLITPEYKAGLDVNVLADAFNVDKTDLPYRIIEIDEFPMDGVYALLADKNFFMLADYVYEVTSFYNPEQLTTNFWLHHWEVISYSPFANAVFFGSAPDTADEIVNITLDSISVNVVDEDGDNASTFSYGDELTVVVNAAADIDPENENFKAPNSSDLEITISRPGATADDPATVIERTSRTYVERMGLLKVQDGLEAGDVITIKATSTYIDPSGDGSKPAQPKTATATITVDGNADANRQVQTKTATTAKTAKK